MKNKYLIILIILIIVLLIFILINIFHGETINGTTIVYNDNIFH